MATRRPLVHSAGSIRELPAGDAVYGLPVYVRAYQADGVTMLKLGLTASYGLAVTKADGTTTLNVAVTLNG